MSRSDDGEVAQAGVVPLRLPWAGLLALSTAAFVDVVTDLAPAGLLPGMSASLGVPEGRVGILVSGYAAASALGAIPLTALVRGLPRRRVLGSVLAGFALANVVTAVSSSYTVTIAGRLAAGAFGGVLWALLAPAAARMVPAGRVPPARRARGGHCRLGPGRGSGPARAGGCRARAAVWGAVAAGRSECARGHVFAAERP
jgi:MFS family permease